MSLLLLLLIFFLLSYTIYISGHLGQIVNEHEPWPYCYTVHAQRRRVALVMMRPKDNKLVLGKRGGGMGGLYFVLSLFFLLLLV